jgi:hypothetical protein
MKTLKEYLDEAKATYCGACGKTHVKGNCTANEDVNEKLDPSMGAGEYVKDFQKSDAPQFKGKTKEKRREMAIAAYMADKQNEEVEQIDELSKNTLQSYTDKAAQDVADHAVKSAKHANIAIGAKRTGSTVLARANQKIADKAQAHANKRVAGLIKAAERMKEDFSLDEAEEWELKKIHTEYTAHKATPTAVLLKKHQARNRVTAKYSAAEVGGKEGLISDLMNDKHGQKRMQAYHSLSKKDKNALAEGITKENEMVTEEKHRVGVTVSEPDHPAVTMRKQTKQKFIRVTAASNQEAVEKAKSHYKKAGYKVHGAEHAGMVQESEELEESKTLKDIAAAAERRAGSVVPEKKKVKTSSQSSMEKIRAAAEKRRMAESEELDEGLKPGWMLKVDPKLAAKVKDKIDLAKKRHDSYGNPASGKTVKEQVEELDEGFSDAQIKKLKDEYSSINTIDPSSPTYKRLVVLMNAQDQETLKKLAGANIKFISGMARNRIKSVKEETEQIDELSKSTLGSYIRSASADRAHSTRAAGVEAGARGPNRYNNMTDKENRAQKRALGISKAVDRLTNEDVELDEGWGADEVTRYGNGYTVWHKKQSGKPGENNVWVYKTPKDAKSDSHAADLIKNQEPLSKHPSVNMAFDAMKKHVKESEEISEISKELARSYLHKAELSEPKDDNQYAKRSKAIEYAKKKIRDSKPTK